MSHKEGLYREGIIERARMLSSWICKVQLGLVMG